MRTSLCARAAAIALLALAASAAITPAAAAERPPWYERLWESITAPFGNSRETFDAAAEATRDATGAIVDATQIRLVPDQSKCIPADGKNTVCQVTAENVCQKKGFKSGKPADTVSYEACAGIASNLTNGGKCKVKHRLVAAACW